MYRRTQFHGTYVFYKQKKENKIEAEFDLGKIKYELIVVKKFRKMFE